ncbi:Beta-galactosidase [Cyphellophora attinorum]|uniref:beta-galactosidase n=1 Tax=Cyphellophora attinorum TaxID=1664694 RepID=A0A0N1NXS4_9EURO|nr:Beta-galactosidase [Phialophora attinorum]KPI35494.1 Beta-galactosidase [Phialophora attinorum]
MSGTFPSKKPDWSNLEVIHRGTLPARAYFHIYNDEASALQAFSSRACTLNLSGTWRFLHSKSPFSAPQGFESPDFDTSSWSDIQVPGHWQLQGWGAPHYTNINYIIPVDPPNVPFDDNQTGSYVRNFTVPPEFVDQQLRLRFEGVDSAFHVYVNGNEVGYSQGSRNASEFDITKFVSHKVDNILAVRVYQWSDASYLEDQDQWRFSGIFRDVALHAFPDFRVEDFYVQTALDDDYKDATLKVNVLTSGTGTLALRLIDPRGQPVAAEKKEVTGSSTTFSIKLFRWATHSQNVGFRRVEIVDGIYKINGRRIVFRGTNRHEHHPSHGRAVPYDFMKRDLLIMKQHNLNAIRTCHQPSDPRLYHLADELGLYIMDEADLECHGFGQIAEAALLKDVKKRDLDFQQRKELTQSSAGSWTSDNPAWKHQYVDRAHQLVSRDKNHPCVVMWSLGNEAFYGCNFQSMYDHIKSIDQTRPIHYEGDFEAKTVDLYSQMYSSVDNIIKFAQVESFTKPLVLCEFVHAMGNGPGNIKEYIEAFYKYPRLQGGWVWEWANHGLISKDLKTGEEFMAYGGDFGDEPNDYNFILDGLMFSNHTPTPGLTEYAKAIEPVQVLGYEDGTATIVNRYDIVTLDHLGCHAYIVGDGIRHDLGVVEIPSDVQPHTQTHVKLPAFDASQLSRGDIHLQLDFFLREGRSWAPAGHIVASSQLQVRDPQPLLSALKDTQDPAPQVEQSAHNLQVTTANSKFTFSLASGRLTSWIKDSVELIHAQMGPTLTLSRALTDNDRPQDGQVSARLAPVVLSWSFALTTTYQIHANGAIHITCSGKPEGANLPETVPRIGFEMALPAAFDTVSWYGRGPGESYKDKKLSQHFGNYTSSVDDLFVDYEFPQENGNRTDVRWVELSSSSLAASSSAALATATQAANTAFNAAQGMFKNLSRRATDLMSPSATQPTAPEQSPTLQPKPAAEPSTSSSSKPSLKASFGAAPGFSFNASHYTSADLEKAKHPFELKPLKRDYVVLRLDADHHGLGTGSCGPKTLDEYALKTAPFEFELVLE